MAVDDSDGPLGPNPLAGVDSFSDLLGGRPEVLVLAVSVLGYDLVVQLTNRFFAGQLAHVGASGVTIGLFGSLGMLLGMVLPYVSGELPESADERLVLVVVGTLSALGMVIWLAAPAFEQTDPLGVHLPAWMWLLVGEVFVYAWRLRGAGTAFAHVQRRTPYESLVTGLNTGESLRRFSLVAGVLPVVGVFYFLTFHPGFQVLVALGAALGFTALVVQLVIGTGGHPPESLDFRGVKRLSADLRSFPRNLEPLLVGDTLGRFAVGMIHMFLVLYLVNVRHLDATVLGIHLDPVVLFSVCMAVEALVALVTVPLGEELVREFGARPTLAGSLVVTAAFPGLLFLAGQDVFAVAAVFGLFGLRFVGQPAREVFVEQLSDAGNERAGRSYRTVRNALVVPSSAVGGVLYVVSPHLLMLGATVVGLVGAATFLRIEPLPDYLTLYEDDGRR